LDQAVKKISEFKVQYPQYGWQWEEFESEILPMLETNLPIALDRMEFHKSLINELEFKHKFTIDSCERLWNIYRPILD
jgi:hypothetical protein